MKKVLAIMLASPVFFWAQPSAALVVVTAGIGSLALPLEKHASNPVVGRITKANVPHPEATEWAHGPATYGLLAVGLLAVALRRHQLMQRWSV